MLYMVRKQLYLTEAQDAELKRQAAKQGVSEATIVRRALDRALKGPPVKHWRPGREEAAVNLQRTWSQSGSSLDEAFDRESLYAGRLDRLTPKS
jgi:hypothetical protein